MIKLYTGSVSDVLSEHIPLNSIHSVITSPPYWQMRLYGDDVDKNEIGQEKTPEEYIDNLVSIFREIRNRLRNDGTLWLNLGDCYTGGGRGGDHADSLTKKQSSNRGSLIEPVPKVEGLGGKQLLGLPWRVALALQKDGWILRCDIIWHVPNKMPESVRDRPSKAHEYLFLLSKKPVYYYDNFAVMEDASDTSTSGKSKKFGGKYKHNGYQTRLASGNESPVYLRRNKRDVWTIPTQPYKGAHFATFPEDLVEPCILAGTSEYGCCKECSTPYDRVVESERIPTRPGTNTKVLTKGRFDFESSLSSQNGKIDHDVVGNRDPLRHISIKNHKGWEKSCKCDTNEIVPCTVLDPFSGSGTTGLVAKRLGRNYIGIDLYKKHTKLAEERIGILNHAN